MVRRLDTVDEAHWLREVTESAAPPEERRLLSALQTAIYAEDIPQMQRLGDELGQRFPGRAVYQLVPSGYEKYIKLLHPVYENLAAADSDITWDDVSRLRSKPALMSRLLRRSRHPDVINESHMGEQVGPRVPWRELADQYDVPWRSEIGDRSFGFRSWPHHLYAPEDGQPGPNATVRLARVVENVVGNADCLFYYDPLKAMDDSDHHPADHGILYLGTVSNLAELANETPMEFPTAIWPRDRSWCIIADYDLPFTVIGGGAQLATALLVDTDLDTIEVTPNTRLDETAQAALRT